MWQSQASILPPLAISSDTPAGNRLAVSGSPHPTYCALVGLLSRVAPHVDDEHVLSLKGPLLSRAVTPVAHKLLLLPMDVFVVNVLQRQGRDAKQCWVSVEAGHSFGGGVLFPDIS